MGELKPCREGVIERSLTCPHIRRGIEFWRCGSLTFEQAMCLLVLEFSKIHEDAMNDAIEASRNAPPKPIVISTATEDRLTAEVERLTKALEFYADRGRYRTCGYASDWRRGSSPRATSISSIRIFASTSCTTAANRCSSE